MTTPLSGTASKYRFLVQRLSREPRYCKVLADVSKPSEHEKLSQALFGVTDRVGGTLLIIRELLDSEFRKKAGHPATILRVNSIASKMMGLFSRRHGLGYVKFVLKSCVDDILARDPKSLEVEASKLSPEAVLESNIKLVDEMCQNVLDRIVGEDVLSAMPRELRAVAHYIQLYGTLFDLDKHVECSVVSLIGGFIMLRFFGPALSLPSTFGILPASQVIMQEQRRSLVLVCKVLQKLCNRERFEESEPHLIPLNDFINRNQEKMRHYLLAVCEDPQKPGTPDTEPFTDLDVPVSFEDLHSKEFVLDDLIFLHKMLDRYSTDIIMKLQEGSSEERMSNSNSNSMSFLTEDADFLKMIIDLGPPPGTTMQSPRFVQEQQQSGRQRGQSVSRARSSSVSPPRTNRSATVAATGDTVTVVSASGESSGSAGKNSTSGSHKSTRSVVDERSDLLVDLNLQHLAEKSPDVIDTSSLERAGFFFRGAKPALDGSAVFYLVLCRLHEELLADADLLTVHVVRTMFKFLDAPFIILCDVSWMDSHINDSTVELMHRAIVNLTRVFSQKHYELMRKIFFVHPTENSMSTVVDILAMMPEAKQKELLISVSQWTSMSDVVSLSDLELPVDSKRFVRYSSIVQLRELTASGPHSFVGHQSVVLGHLSIIFLSEKNDIVVDIPLSFIEEIKPSVTQDEIELKLHSQFPIVGDHHFLQRKQKLSPGSSFLISCTSLREREQVSHTIYERSLLAHLRSSNRFLFDVVKTNHRKRRQNRTFFLGIDSLFNVKDGSLRKEVPYNRISNVLVDMDKSQLFMDVVLEDFRSKRWIIESPHVQELHNTLQMCKSLQKQEVDSSIRRSKDLIIGSDTMDRFFESIGGEEVTRRRYSERRKTGAAVTVDEEAYSKLLDWFQKLDKDGSGEVSLVELASSASGLDIGVSESELCAALSALDVNQTGSVSKAVFLTAFIRTLASSEPVSSRKASYSVASNTSAFGTPRASAPRARSQTVSRDSASSSQSHSRSSSGSAPLACQPSEDPLHAAASVTGASTPSATN
eukprot:ANDGO_06111.mRNA.1 Neurofibromin-A